MLDAELYSEDEPPPDPVTSDPEAAEKQRLDAEPPVHQQLRETPPLTLPLLSPLSQSP